MFSMEREIEIHRIKTILPELYNEIRQRREHDLKLIALFSSFCAVSIGWIIAVQKPLTSLAIYFVASIILFLGLIIEINLFLQ